MRLDILLAIRGLAQIYDKPITEDLNEIWTRVLSELSPDELSHAVKAYVLDPNSVYFPKPGQIYGLARPVADKEEEAALITDRIFAALRHYGTDKLGVSRAQLKIGDLGWNFIVNQGGWEAFVKSVQSESDIPILKSQCRKSVMGLIHRGRSDIPHLPDKFSTTLESLGIKMKQLS